MNLGLLPDERAACSPNCESSLQPHRLGALATHQDLAQTEGTRVKGAGKMKSQGQVAAIIHLQLLGQSRIR